MFAENAPWAPEAYILSRLTHAVELGNWQRGMGKGAKPDMIKTPDPSKPVKHDEYVGRLKRLGLLKPKK
jgi:hypothetical protein